jgi:dTDP-4-amino-4,6-dideoxygalactose transaminase
MIRLSKSCIGQEEIGAVTSVLKEEFLGMGREVSQLEDALRQYLGREALCVASGTSALHLALQSIGIGPGDEVLVPSLTYVASFQAISATGATPVACDVLEDTLTLDPEDAQRRITARTKAIMPVHYCGGVGKLEEIYAIAARSNLRVIEDAAHAFGSTYKGELVGSTGDIVCFSFDGIKNITCGEGGAVVSADPEVLDRVKDARLLGVNRDSENRYTRRRSWSFDVHAQGWRYHMSNIMAAIGLEQLKKLPILASQRCFLAHRYNTLFADNKNVKLLDLDFTKIVPHIYVVKLDAKFDRELVRNKLSERGIETGVHWFPNHCLSFYRVDKQISLPVTERIYPQIITLPLHPDLDLADQDKVVENLLEILNEL